MHIVPANLAKRSGAAIFDFIMTIVLWLGLVTFVFSPIYNELYGTQQIQEDYIAIQLESNLFLKDDETKAIVAVADEDVLDTLIAYYRDFKDGKTYFEQTTPFTFSFAWFNESVLKIDDDSETVTYFEFDVDGSSNPNPNVVAVPKTDASETDIKEFLQTAYKAAQLDLSGYIPYRELAQLISKYSLQIIFLSAFVTLSIFYLLIPLLFKNGQTLAKRLFGLGVVSSKGYRMRWWQIIVRWLIYGVEIVASIYTIMGAILISYTLMIFTKDNRSIHDFIAQTKVVDLKHSLIFDNAQDQEDYDHRKNESNIIDAEVVG